MNSKENGICFNRYIIPGGSVIPTDCLQIEDIAHSSITLVSLRCPRTKWWAVKVA